MLSANTQAALLFIGIYDKINKRCSKGVALMALSLVFVLGIALLLLIAFLISHNGN